MILLLVGLPGHRLFGPLMRKVVCSGALFERTDLIRSCLEEAAETDLEPFLAQLAPEVTAERQAAVLRLLLGRREKDLLEKAGRLAAAGEGEVKALAERLLAEAARTDQGEGASRDLFLLGPPAAVAAATRQLGTRGIRIYEAADPDDWESELEEILAHARGLGLVFTASQEPAWSQEEVWDCVKLFLDENRPVIPLLPSGERRRPDWEEELPTLEWVELGREDAAAAVERLLAQAAGAERVPAARPGTAGKTFTELRTGIRFLWIDGGRFEMGGTAYPDEQPIHPVRVSPFWLGETPVTNRQYGVFLEATKHAEPQYWRERQFSNQEQPVVGVSWEDAQAFCEWLSGESGREIILPSEAQWEYAARGSDGREYPWGDEEPDETRACFQPHWKEQNPAPVDSYPAGKGPFGTLDQAGNVWEWCRDVWDEEAYKKRKEREVTDPVVTEGGVSEARVGRGGGWSNPAEDLRAAVRFGLHAGLRHVGLGFRVAVASPTR